MDMCLPKFDTYQKLKQTQTLDVLTFFQKKRKKLCDIRSEIHLVRRNIDSTGHSCRA